MLDKFSPEYEALSDHLSDDDYSALKGPVVLEDNEEPLEWYLWTCSTRPPSSYLRQDHERQGRPLRQEGQGTVCLRAPPHMTLRYIATTWQRYTRPWRTK